MRRGVNVSSSLALTTTRNLAAHVAPAPSRCHAVCCPPARCAVAALGASAPRQALRRKPLRAVRVLPRRGRRAPEVSGAERGAPVRPAPARHASTSLRFVPASRARPIVTGGDPAAPGRVPGSPQPRAAGCADACRAARGSAIPLASLALRLRSLRSLRPGPPGPALAVPARSPRPWPGRALRAVTNITTGKNAGPDAAAPLRL